MATSTGSNPAERLRAFELERFFAQHEFTAEHLLCVSDVEPLMLSDVLAFADADSLQRWNTLWLGYTESQGMPALREEVTKLYDTVTADQVVVCAPEEGIYLSMLALLRPGDRIICTAPGYQSLYETALSLGCTVVPWHVHTEDSARGAYLDVDDLERLLAEAPTRLVVVNSPHNPTGAVLAPAEFERACAATAAAGAWLFSDEMYRYLEISVERHRSAADFTHDAFAGAPRTITLCGMSKTFASAGLRIGWVIIKDEAMRKRVRELKDYTTICSSGPSEVLALAVLRARERMVARSRALVEGNLAAWEAFCAKHPGVFRWVAPAGASVAWPEVVTGETAKAFSERVLADTGILLLPQDNYHFTDPARQHVRVGTGRATCKDVLALLDAYLTKNGQ